MSPAGSVSHTPVAEQFPNNPLLLSAASRAHSVCSVARVSKCPFPSEGTNPCFGSLLETLGALLLLALTLLCLLSRFY